MIFFIYWLFKGCSKKPSLSSQTTMGFSKLCLKIEWDFFVEYRESNPNKLLDTYVPNYSPAVVEYRPTSQLLPKLYYFSVRWVFRIAHTGIKQFTSVISIGKLCTVCAICFNSQAVQATKPTPPSMSNNNYLKWIRCGEQPLILYPVLISEDKFRVTCSDQQGKPSKAT